MKLSTSYAIAFAAALWSPLVSANPVAKINTMPSALAGPPQPPLQDASTPTLPTTSPSVVERARPHLPSFTYVTQWWEFPSLRNRIKFNHTDCVTLAEHFFMKGDNFECWDGRDDSTIQSWVFDVGVWCHPKRGCPALTCTLSDLSYKRFCVPQGCGC